MASLVNSTSNIAPMTSTIVHTSASAATSTGNCVSTFSASSITSASSRSYLTSEATAEDKAIKDYTLAQSNLQNKEQAIVSASNALEEVITGTESFAAKALRLRTNEPTLEQIEKVNKGTLRGLVRSAFNAQNQRPQNVNLIKAIIREISEFDQGYAPSQDEVGQTEDRRIALVAAVEARTRYAATFTQARDALLNACCSSSASSDCSSRKENITNNWTALQGRETTINRHKELVKTFIKEQASKNGLDTLIQMNMADQDVEPQDENSIKKSTNIVGSFCYAYVEVTDRAEIKKTKLLIKTLTDALDQRAKYAALIAESKEFLWEQYCAPKLQAILQV